MTDDLNKLAEITKTLNNRDSSYLIQEKYLTELAKIQRTLLKSRDLYTLSEAIDNLGNFLKPSRILLYIREDNTGNLIQEWYNTNEVAEHYPLTTLPLTTSNFLGSNKTFTNGKYIHSTFRELTPESRLMLEENNGAFESFIAMPLYTDDVLYAVILIVENHVEDRWPQTRLNFLSSLQTSFSFFITHWQSYNKTLRQVENLTYLFDNSLPCVLDDINGIIKDVNTELANILGYPKEGLIGKNWDTIISPNDLQKVKEHHTARYFNPHQAPREYITKFITATGKELTVKVHTSLLPNGQVYSNIIDLTDCEKTRTILKLAYASMSIIPSNFVITDQNGTAIFCSEGFATLHGYLTKDIIGTNTRILKSGKHPIDFYEDLWNTIQQGETWEGTLINLTKDKQLINSDTTIQPLFDDKVIIGFIGIKTN